MNGLSTPQIAALVSYSSFGLWLSIYDIRHHQLPNRVVLVLTVVLIVCAILSSDFYRSILFALIHAVIYVVMFVISRGQLGMGDVKYAFPTGMIGSMFAVNLSTAVMIVFALAGIVSLSLVFLHKATWRTRIAFGPFMTAGILVAVGWTHLGR